MSAAQQNALRSGESPAANGPAPAQPTNAKPSVVSLYNEQDLTRAIAPWERLGQRQKWVKAQLILADLAVMWLCLIVGRLPLLIRNDMDIWAALTVWWSNQGQLRVVLFIAMSLLMVGWMGAVQGHYTAARRKPWWNEVHEVLKVVAVAAMIDAMLIFFGKWELSRLWTGVSWALIFAVLPFSRLWMRHRLLKSGLLAQPYVLIGRSEDVEVAAAALASEPLMGYQPVAVIAPEPGERLVYLKEQEIAPTPLTSSVRAFLAKPGPYQVVAVMGNEGNAWLRELTESLMLTRDDVVIIPALNGLPLHGMEVSHFFSHEVLLLRARNNLNRRAPQVLKRLIDVVGAALLGVLLSPLLVYVAYRIRQGDNGPVFFTQKRVGKNGELFDFIKFRSMVLNADEALESWKVEHPELYVQYVASNFKLAKDPRVTPIGNIIRRTSIDELPQLLNVLRGDMSLVGPRPLLPRELADYGPAITTYGKARPGITGLWQVNGRSSSSFNHRIAMDLWYVRNWSLWYDLAILLRTIRVVLKQEGAV